MTDEETLEQAVQQAIINGWDIFDDGFNYGGMLFPNEETGEGDYVITNDDDINPGIGGIGFDSIYDIIYSHEFAKALWGDSWYSTISHTHHAHVGVEVHKRIKSWQYRLQQMVIAEDPLAYLRDSL